jgi:hypothetical protein
MEATMANDRQTLLGLFSSEAQTAAAVTALRETGFTLEQVHSPIPSHVLEEALRLPKSKVGWFTLVGGVVGFICGFWLAAFTASRWSLIVGGKPVLAWIPFVIVGFEFTILFAVFGNVVGLITQARLPRRLSKTPYDPRLSGDRFGIAASCPMTDEGRLRRFFEQLGAELAPATLQPAVDPPGERQP